MDNDFGQVVLVKDINPNPFDLFPSGSFPGSFVELNDKLYFGADDGTPTGRELWVSDGTTEGTNLVADIDPGPYSYYGRSGESNPANLAEFDGKIYFSANDGVAGQELWVTDGTAEGTSLFADINPGSGASNPANFVEFDDQIYFSANDGVAGQELWVTDSTAEGTSLVADIRPGGRASNPANFVELNGKLYFTADDDGAGKDLWVTDGTNLVADTDIVSGSNLSRAVDFVELNGKLYFTAKNSVAGNELWVTDGTAEGTSLVADINPGLSDSINIGRSGSNPVKLTEFDGKIYFSANDGVAGQELWVTDGTSEGTSLVADINPGSDASSPEDFTEFDGKLYFNANDGETGEELWVTDGTAEGTSLVADINPGRYFSNPGGFAGVGDELFFSARDGSTGTEFELYKLTFDGVDEPREPINVINGGNGNDSLLGTDGADEIDGGNGNDSLVGGGGNDILFGGNGDDNLVGGGGNDSLIGDNGRDLFVIETGQGSDIFADFTIGEDSIGLVEGLQYEALVFDGENIFSGDELLATVEGVNTQQIGVDSFEII